MAIIAPFVMRFSLNGTQGNDVTWTNVLDVSTLGDVSIPRANIAARMADVIASAWATNLAPLLSDNVTLRSISWVDLDSADGSVGSLDGIDFSGTQAEAPSPANVAVLVRKVTTSTRGARNGRWYQLGLPEADADWATVVPAVLTAWQTAFGNFRDALDGPQTDPSFDSIPKVVHTRNIGTPENPNIVYESDTEITAMEVQPRLATQRRRLRR